MFAAIDTGILVALTNADEDPYRRNEIIKSINDLRKNHVAFISNIPVITESFHLCYRYSKISGSVALEANLEKYGIAIYDIEESQKHIRNYKYLLDRNINVDFADFYLYTTCLLYDANIILTIDRKDLFTLNGAFKKHISDLPFQPEWARHSAEDIRVFNA